MSQPFNFKPILDECMEEIKKLTQTLNEMERRGTTATPAEERKFQRELKVVGKRLAGIVKKLAAIN